MVIEASIVGAFKTILIIIGALVVLRFFGQLMQAKRAMEEERKMNASRRKEREEVEHVRKNYGKTQITSSNSARDQIEDVEYEEI